MVTEEALKVVAAYWDTRIANVVKAVFNGSLNSYNILITGRSGVGKTTYAYYGLKVGYIKYLLKNRCEKYGGAYCVDKLVNEDVSDEAKRSPRYLTRDELEELRLKFLRERLYDALDGLEMGYGLPGYGTLCFGPDCTKPDGIDEKLRDGLFVTEDDIGRMSLLLAKVLDGKAKPPKALLLDDALYRSQFWDSEYRRLYMLVKHLLAHHRGIAPLVIATAINRIMVLKEYVKNAANVDAQPYTDDAHYIEYAWWRRFRASFRRPYNYDEDTATSEIRYAFTIDVQDFIPKERAFKLPKWFEEAHWVRRKLILRRAVEKYLAESKKADD